jgi:peptide deformylase
VLRIVKYPHPALRHKSRPLRRVDGELKKAVREMFDLMYQHKGVGLAANQVDLPYRVFILNLQSDPTKAEEYVFINPVISRTAREGKRARVFEIYAPVKRSDKSQSRLTTLPAKVSTSLAACLPGRFSTSTTIWKLLFIDRLSPTALMTIKDSLSKLEREFQGERHRGVIPDDNLIAARLQNWNRCGREDERMNKIFETAWFHNFHSLLLKTENLNKANLNRSNKKMRLI